MRQQDRQTSWTWIAITAIVAVASPVALALGPAETSGVSALRDSKQRLPAIAPAATPGKGGPSVAAPQAPKDDLSSPDALLDGFEITAAKFAALVPGQGMEANASSQRLLSRVLFRLPNISLALLDRWTTADADVSSWGTDEVSKRRQFFTQTGRILQLEEVAMSERDVLLWNFKSYFRCHVVLGGAKTPAVVYARDVPQAWLPGEPLDEAISFTGMYLAPGEANDGVAMPPMFAVDRLAWHADTLLGSSGFDVGLFDTVRSGRKLHSDDRECFYQLLNAAGVIRQDTITEHASAGVGARRTALQRTHAELKQQEAALTKQLSTMEVGGDERKRAARELGRVQRDLIVTEAANRTTSRGFSDFISVLEQPSASQGELLKFRGTALRILRVPLGRGDRDIISRFGFDHYYEIDAIVSLDLDIQISTPKKEESKKAEKDRKLAESASEDEETTGSAEQVAPSESAASGREASTAEGIATADEKQTTPSGSTPSASPETEQDETGQDEQPEAPPVETISRYPITFCVRTLPKGMPTGPTVNEPIQIIGFHMKNWRYATTGPDGDTVFRSAPLLIGRMPLEQEPSALSNPLYAAIAGGLFVAALAVMWISVWMLGRGDRKFEMATMSNRFALEEGETLDELDVPGGGAPDFSCLEELPAGDGQRTDGASEGADGTGETEETAESTRDDGSV